MSPQRVTALFSTALLVLGVHVGGTQAAVPVEFQPNYDEGYDAGYPIGYKFGYAEGKVSGWNSGWSTGHSDGYDDGWSDAYPLAFDLGYDEQYPVGHRAGWDEGLVVGFDEGLAWAPVVATTLYGVEISSGNRGGSGSMSGTLSVNFSGMIMDSGNLSWVDNSIDWAQHYYDAGFLDGNLEGRSSGSTDGYNETYPVAYDRAYPIGHLLGVGEGTQSGKHDGGDEGYDDGWDEGYNVAWDAGFYAGVDYGIFGEFIEPQYSLQYTRRSDPLAARTLLAMNAPEPGCLAIVAVGGVILGAARRKRALLQA